jgi:hypothetical protein
MPETFFRARSALSYATSEEVCSLLMGDGVSAEEAFLMVKAAETDIKLWNLENTEV